MADAHVLSKVEDRAVAVSYLETGVLYREDNLIQLAQFPAECVDLVYLDPPFFSNRVYEVIWGDEAEVRSFEDRWEGGIQHYIDWMRNRVIELHRVLKPTGSLYLHCDSHASHYLKIMLDGIFGPERFVNELIWKRSSAHSDTRQGARHFGRVTDTILFYSKSTERTFNTVYQPYDQAYIDRDYKRMDPDGRRYRISDMSGPGGAAKGNPFYEVMGVSRHWRYTQEKMEDLIAAGRVVQTRPGAVPQYKRYLDEMPGVPAQNLWADLPALNNRSRERLGYPTQKPESLLERIIRVSSNEGDIVLDPFCGCGTTVSVAERLGRRWIGIDISPTAANIMQQRLIRNTHGRCQPKMLGMPVTEQDLRDLKPFEFQNWAIQRVWGTHSPRKSGDMGIDGYSFMVHDPIQVKQSDKVGRNVVDNFQTAMRREQKSKGYIIAFSFTKNAKEEVARARWEEKLDIQLVTVKQLLNPDPEKRGALEKPMGDLHEMPLPAARPVDALPSADELVASDQGGAAAG